MAALLQKSLRARRRQRLIGSQETAPEYVGAMLMAFRRSSVSRTLSTETELLQAVQPLPDPLSARELEVLRLVAAGNSNRDISAQLFVTVDTVKKHLTHIFAKLGVSSRTQALARARELELISQ